MGKYKEAEKYIYKANYFKQIENERTFNPISLTKVLNGAEGLYILG